MIVFFWHSEAMQTLAKVFVFAGSALLVIGLLMLLGPKELSLGRLPGDFIFKRGNMTFYFPLTSGIVVSILLTIIAKLWNYFR